MNHVDNATLPRSTSPAARPRAAARVVPLVDVHENKDEILLVADVPGATAEGIHLSLDKGTLTILAERAAAPDGAGRGADASVIQAEYRPRDYQRVFTVPEGVDASRIEASLSAGVLKVRLPKVEAVKSRQIKVTAG